MNRRQTRELAFKLVFQNEFQPDIPLDRAIETSVAAVAEYGIGSTEDNIAYLAAALGDIRESSEEYERIIAENSRNWKVSRISKSALSILKLALYEIIKVDTMPNEVCVNEAIEIIKRYDPESASFVNGVLGSYLRGEAPSCGADIQGAVEKASDAKTETEAAEQGNDPLEYLPDEQDQ